MKNGRRLLALPVILALSFTMFAPFAAAGDLCREARRARGGDPAVEATPAAAQGAGAVVNDDGTSAAVAPIESGGPFADAARAARPGPQAISSGGGSPAAGAGLLAQSSRGGAFASAEQRAARQIRLVIRRLH